MAFAGGPSDSGVDVNKWKERKFPKGSPARAMFEYLCLRGCEPRGLLSLLTVVTVAASKGRLSIYDAYGVSQSALVKLPKGLEKISRELEAANRLLRPFMLSFVENPELSDQVRSRWSQKATAYQSTPVLLRALATDLRATTPQIGKFAGPKKYDFLRHTVFMLLEYVDTCTKSPHYQAVADLLTHLFSTGQKTSQIVEERLPKATRAGARQKDVISRLLTSHDALKAFYLRSAKYGLYKARRSKSKRPPSA